MKKHFIYQVIFFLLIMGSQFMGITNTFQHDHANITESNLSLKDAPVVTLLPFEPICSQAILPMSGGSPAGGTYVYDNTPITQFDASLFGAGSHEIFYVITYDGTDYQTSQILKVLQIPCVTITYNPVTCHNGTDGTITVIADNSCVEVKSISFFPEVKADKSLKSDQADKSFFAAIYPFLSPGIYTIIIEGINGCTYTEVVNLLNPPLPEASITVTGETEFCEGGEVTLTAAENKSYLWSNGETTRSITVNQSGTYTVTVTNEKGCTNTSAPVAVVANPNPDPVVFVDGNLFLCEGEITVLSTEVFASYLWSNNETTRSISVSESGVYSVTVTDTKGCTAVSENVTITVSPRPVAEITVTGDTEFCEGNSILLTATEANEYLWSNGATTQSITVTESGIFTVTTFNTDGCSSVSEPVTIVVNPLPIADVTITGDLTFCEGNSVTLTASENDSYLWSNGETSQSITVSQSGVFYVTVTAENGCKNTSEPITVTVNSLPLAEIEVSGDLVFCEGGSVTLTATENSSYLWSNNATTQSITVDQTGSFSVVVTDANGCLNESEVIDVIVNPNPQVEILTWGDLEFCLGGSVDLTSTEASEYLWSTGETTQTITVTETGTFTVTVTSEKGCSNTSEPVSVLVNPLPEVEILVWGDLAFCEGGSVTLTSTEAAEYLWSNGATTQSIVVEQAGSFSVVITDVNGCVNESEVVEVIVNSNPVADILIWGDLEFCEGGSVDLTSTEGSAYLWSNGETTQTITVNVSGDYTVTVTNESGCSSTSEAVTVNVIALPVLSIESFTVCHDQVPFILENATPAGGVYSGEAVTDGIFDPSVAGVGTHTILYTYTDPVTGCESSTEGTITVSSPLEITAVITDLEVFGTGTGAISLTVTGGSAPYTYMWDNGETTATIENIQAGEYFVVVSDANGCFTSETFTVNHNSILVDLGITIEVNIQTPDPNEVDEIIFAVVVSNLEETETATGVVVNNLLPEPFPFIARLDDGTSGAYNPETGVWTIGTIPAGEYRLLVYRTEMLLTEPEEVKSWQSAVNAASILPFDQVDPVLANNYAEIVVSVGESTSGDDNGIESNGSMASKLALRSHRRLVESKHIPRNERAERMESFDRVSMLTGDLKSSRADGHSSTGLAMLLPERGPVNTKAFVSTPADLIGITNAREIFSVDYLQENNARRAAILAISTDGKSVYEHTKVICDRLVGADLRNVELMEIAGKPFILSHLVHPNGYIDYSVSFIAQKTGNGFVIDNRWYNEEYELLNVEDIYNFQVWSTTPQFTRQLVEEMLQTMEMQGGVEFRNNEITPSVPQVYVRSGRYTNGGLLLNLVNKVGASRIIVYGSKTLYENGQREPMHISLNIPTTKEVEVFIPTGYIFDAGFSISNNKDNAPDLLYYADGAWMYDYDRQNASVNHFATKAETNNVEAIDYLVERDASFSGYVRTWASMFRSLNPRNMPEDLSAFDQIVFNAKGEGTVEVMLAKKGVKAWNEQYRTTITLTAQEREYRINFSDLATREGEKGFAPDDVVSVIFNAVGNGSSLSTFDVKVSKLHFANSSFTRASNAIFYPAYPNPFRIDTSLDLIVTNDSHVRVEILNTFGQTVEILTDKEFTSGSYKLRWIPAGHNPGVYVVRMTVGENVYTSKVVYQK